MNFRQDEEHKEILEMVHDFAVNEVKPLAAEIDQTEEFKVNGGETMTMNLAQGSDGKSHYAVLSVTLLMNTKRAVCSMLTPFISASLAAIRGILELSLRVPRSGVGAR